MRIRIISIALIVGLFVGIGDAYGQDYQQMRSEVIEKQKSTRAEIEQLNEQIQKYEERLQLAEQKYEALYDKYQDLKNLIALQDQKLKKLQDEQSQIEQEIDVTTRSLEQKRDELKTLIENYKETLDYLYKHGQTSQLALIFSSSSINQMLIRSYYLEKFNAFREKQAQQIREAQKELEQTKLQLVDARSKNEDILTEIKQEKAQLAEKKAQQQKNVTLLRENKVQIADKLDKVQQQKANFNDSLSVLIQREKEIREAQEARLARIEKERKRKLSAAKEIEDDAKRAKEVAKYSEPVERDNFLDSDRLKQIEQQFAQSKERLPWPVDSRTVSEHFGKKRHPVYGTETPNLGIEIVTDSKASVRVVHPGYVIAIRPFPSYGDVVLVKHGRFITAYGNLSQVMVNKNDILQQGDIIGLAGNDSSPKGESLFFMIRENNDNLDPEHWLQTDAVSSTY
jgi:septal ring factor EnvC (AmiA/AmiB activator)